ncbi:hypothetical protein CTAYLR_003179 [Chrysophaeum taylorii]|uniref:Redoxin domain-containing protein n=1 Tax=Chrysophaeum taylorii TaxID=2483200 RepID=A0AAD7XKI6_9STRA|nr:hypothetical protein CTAYLR_003179 [Chrysophaeum taylorii]
MVAVGDPLPDVTVHRGDAWPAIPVKLRELVGGRKVVIVPGYIAAEKELRSKGIEKVFVFCVNDAAVMGAWAKDQGIEGTIVEFIADPHGELTKALDVAMTHPGPMSLFGVQRSKRVALVYENDVAKIVEVSEGPDDPAGDADPTGPITAKTLVANILAQL